MAPEKISAKPMNFNNKPYEKSAGSKENIDQTMDMMGLTDAERAIITATSQYARSISQISRKTKVPRSSLLYILRKLQERSLVRAVRHENGKWTKWVSTIDKTIRHLNYVSHKGDQLVEVYYGSAAIFEMFEKIIILPKNSRLLALQPDSSIRYALRKNKVDDFLRVNKGIKNKALIVEGIVHEKSVGTIVTELGKVNGQKIFESFIGRLEDYVKIPDDFADVESEIYIFGGSAYIINWHKETAVSIHEENMVALLRAMFSCVKELGQRYSQNEKMKLHSPR